MQITPIVTYLVYVLSSFRNVAIISVIVIFIYILSLLFNSCLKYPALSNKEWKDIYKIIKKMVVVILFLLIFICVIPTKKTLTKIINEVSYEKQN